jgi:hypothetical protein
MQGPLGTIGFTFRTFTSCYQLYLLTRSVTSSKMGVVGKIKGDDSHRDTDHHTDGGAF